MTYLGDPRDLDELPMPERWRDVADRVLPGNLEASLESYEAARLKAEADYGAFRAALQSIAEKLATDLGRMFAAHALHHGRSLNRPWRRPARRPHRRKHPVARRRTVS